MAERLGVDKKPVVADGPPLSEATMAHHREFGAKPKTRSRINGALKPDRLKRKDYMDRPARLQTDRPIATGSGKEEGAFWNIWYERWQGGNSYRQRERKLAPTRCCIATDAGLTRGNTKKGAFICLHFAKGRCIYGADCPFLHRLPNEDDDKRLEVTKDIFGRERFSTDREDMGGVGCFNRDNKTLYLGGLQAYANKDLEEVIWRHFTEWGDILQLKVFADRCIAFVEYRSRSSCEFAREAMMDQRLDGNEVLNVRWAYEDPNPRVRIVRHAEKVVTAVNAVIDRYGEENLAMTDPDAFYRDQAQRDDEENFSKRRRVEEPGAPAPAPAADASAAGGPPADPAAHAAAWAQYYAAQQAQYFGAQQAAYQQYVQNRT
eukprot:tig00000402_g216.t1